MSSVIGPERDEIVSSSTLRHLVQTVHTELQIQMRLSGYLVSNQASGKVRLFGKMKLFGKVRLFGKMGSSKTRLSGYFMLSGEINLSLKVKSSARMNFSKWGNLTIYGYLVKWVIWRSGLYGKVGYLLQKI